MKTKAFTVVDIMIVVVIIGILSAMAIPAFQKVREQSLIKAHQRGDRLTPDEEKLIEGKLGGPKISTMRINGQVYYLYPKSTTFEEMRLQGETYILIPAQ